ncbi:aminotransferase class V-fold PLP-dependent enzyme [Candidatus Dependentiae bacterium]|nr:aminotransferase class V-fold PLP-dependent enzyme [Candidatus Dependentiae bacterium]
MDATRIKKDFPFFENNPSLVYLDNAATTQKPKVVIDALSEFYSRYNAPVHRGIYDLAEKSTDLYEQTRAKVAAYCGAFEDEIIFTRGTTEGINFIVTAWASTALKAGDEVLITEIEHHANSVPWIRLEKEKGIVLKYVPMQEDGTLDYEAYLRLLTTKTKIVACTHTSNVLGTRTNLPFIIEHAHAQGARVLVDAAQAAGREHLSLHSLKADCVVFSAHKMCGPTGLGILYIARSFQDEVPPYHVGGGMVHSVDFHEVSWAGSPWRYEAGTPPFAQVYAFGATLDYLATISFDDLRKHEAALCSSLIEGLQKIPHIRILGSPEELRISGHMVSFVNTLAHPHDVAAFLSMKGICVRAGNHCAQLLHKKLGIFASIRASFYLYSTQSDVDALLQALSF